MSTTPSKSRTIRELGGEIWAEMFIALNQEERQVLFESNLVDTIMGVLARHVGTTIENDEDIPVTLLAKTSFDLEE